MRKFAAIVLVACCLAQPAAVLQSQSPAGTTGIRACSLLPKDLMVEVMPHEKQARDLILSLPPDEDPPGTCHYGGVTLQVDPFTPARVDALYEKYRKSWVPVSGVGDAAFFNNNRDRYAELIARAGTRVFTIQMDVPSGHTAESTKPHVIALAKVIESKLR